MSPPVPGSGAGLDEGDELEDRVVGERLEGDRLLVRDRGEAERGDLVAGVGGQLEGVSGPGSRFEAGGAVSGGDAERPAEADDRRRARSG